MKLEKITNMLYPRRCPLCDETICSNELICPDCKKDIRVIGNETCRKCGKELVDSQKIYCYDCSKKIHYFDRGYSVFVYENIKQSLYRFKYSGRAEYARFYAAMAIKIHGKELKLLNADALIPVPIHVKRKRKRGYNQAEVLAKELSRYLEIPVMDKLIKRKKSTIPLKKLDEKGRLNNLKRAFTISVNSVELETIIIIDDIYTTGATIDTISAVLRDAGVKNIYFLTVSIGKGL